MSDDNISYYRMDPDGAEDGAGHVRTAPESRRQLWILVALAVVILVMVVALIGINMAEGRAMDSSSAVTTLGPAAILAFA